MKTIHKLLISVSGFLLALSVLGIILSWAGAWQIFNNVAVSKALSIIPALLTMVALLIYIFAQPALLRFQKAKFTLFNHAYLFVGIIFLCLFAILGMAKFYDTGSRGISTSDSSDIQSALENQADSLFDTTNSLSNTPTNATLSNPYQTTQSFGSLPPADNFQNAEELLELDNPDALAEAIDEQAGQTNTNIKNLPETLGDIAEDPPLDDQATTPTLPTDPTDDPLMKDETWENLDDTMLEQSMIEMSKEMDRNRNIQVRTPRYRSPYEEETQDHDASNLQDL